MGPYISPEHQPIRVGASQYDRPPTQDFSVADTNKLFKSLRGLYMKHGGPGANPNLIRWNIVQVGHICVGFMLGMSIS